MIDQHDIGPGVPADERALLGEVADRLERGRPVPRAAFRGDLRRLLVDKRRTPVAVGPGRWRALVATYSGLGALLLAVAAIGLAGVGPFAA